jgi:hypothetical protein
MKLSLLRCYVLVLSDHLGSVDNMGRILAYKETAIKLSYLTADQFDAAVKPEEMLAPL